MFDPRHVPQPFRKRGAAIAGGNCKRFALLNEAVRKHHAALAVEVEVDGGAVEDRLIDGVLRPCKR